MPVTLEDLSALARYYPRDVYTPHAGQLRFHRAKHKYRCLFPGNRFGKSTAMGVEVCDAVRKPRSHVVWIAPEYRQFDQIRGEILERACFDHGWTWNGSDNFYRWPNDSRMFVFSNDSDWRRLQGINPDLVCVDEQCDLALWREAQARGYGRKDTRYIVAATATQAESWMEHMIYRPWLEYHAARGMSEDEAAVKQIHPEYWVWPRGGIDDNPTMTAEKRLSFKAINWGDDKARQVRVGGGFMRLTGDGVFDAGAVEWLRTKIRPAAYQGIDIKP